MRIVSRMMIIIMMIKMKIRMDDVDDKILRRGCRVKKCTRHTTRIHLGTAWS